MNSEANRGGPAPNRYRVVIVDDHAETRELLDLRLSMVSSLEVVGQASDGIQGIQLARHASPDLMTLDLEMPRMGGAEAIPRLRAIAPQMRIVVYGSNPDGADLKEGSRPDAIVTKGGSLADLVAIITGLLAESPDDTVEIDLGRLPIELAIEAFDSWVGLYARVREALGTTGDDSTQLLGANPVDRSDLLCLMGVFMQFGHPLVTAKARQEKTVELRFAVKRAPGVAARRALLALGGNGTLRAFNKRWSHEPTRAAERALDVVDSRLVDQLPPS